jgi:hypothetical protein
MTSLNNLSTNIAVTNPSLGVLYAEFDSHRLPDYARMDVSLSKSIQFSQTMALRFNASVINLFDRSNIFYFNRITGQRVDQLPILPTLSVGLDF